KKGVISKGKIKREGQNWTRDYYIILNSAGKKTEMTMFNSDSSFAFKMGYEYIDSALMNEIIFKSADSIARSRKVFYKYDGNGNVIEESWNKADGTLDGKNIFRYDEKGNMIEKEYSNMNEPKKDSLAYDENNNVIEMWSNWNTK